MHHMYAVGLDSLVGLILYSQINITTENAVKHKKSKAKKDNIDEVNLDNNSNKLKGFIWVYISWW